MRKRLTFTTCLSTIVCTAAFAQQGPISQGTINDVGTTIDQQINETNNAIHQTHRNAEASGQATINSQGEINSDVNVATERRATERRATDRRQPLLPRARNNNAVRQNMNRGYQSYDQGYGQIQGQSYGQVQGQYGQTSGSSEWSGQGWNQGMQPSHTFASNQVHTLRFDQTGREFICVQGQRVYFDNSYSQMPAHQGAMSGQATNGGQDDRYRAGYGSYDNDPANPAATAAQGNPDATSQNFDAPALKPGADAKLRGDAAASTESSQNRLDAKAGTATDLDVQADRDASATKKVDAQLDADAGSRTQLDSESDADVNLQGDQGSAIEGELDADVDGAADLDLNE